MCVFQLMEEIAAKEKEEAKEKSKAKEEKKEKGKKDKEKGKEEVEVGGPRYVQRIFFSNIYHVYQHSIKILNRNGEYVFFYSFHPLTRNCCNLNSKNLFQTQEEEVGLRMLPSAFLPELQVGHKTYKGMSSSNTVDHHHL